MTGSYSAHQCSSPWHCEWGPKLASFAVTIGSEPVRPETILMILDERNEADEIAAQMRRAGLDVEVHELSIHRTHRGTLYRDVTRPPVLAP